MIILLVHKTTGRSHKILQIHTLPNYEFRIMLQDTARAGFAVRVRV